MSGIDQTVRKHQDLLEDIPEPTLRIRILKFLIMMSFLHRMIFLVYSDLVYLQRFDSVEWNIISLLLDSTYEVPKSVLYRNLFLLFDVIIDCISAISCTTYKFRSHRRHLCILDLLRENFLYKYVQVHWYNSVQ